MTTHQYAGGAHASSVPLPPPLRRYLLAMKSTDAEEREEKEDVDGGAGGESTWNDCAWVPVDARRATGLCSGGRGDNAVVLRRLLSQSSSSSSSWLVEVLATPTLVRRLSRYRLSARR